MAHGSLVAKIPAPAGEAEAYHHERQSPQQMCAHTPRSCPPPDHATAPNLVPIKINGLIRVLQMQYGHNNLQSRALVETRGPSLQVSAPPAPTGWHGWLRGWIESLGGSFALIRPKNQAQGDF